MISRTGNEICCDKNQICALRFFWDFICVIPHSCNRIFWVPHIRRGFLSSNRPSGKEENWILLTMLHLPIFLFSDVYTSWEFLFCQIVYLPNVGGLLLLLVSALFVPAACTAICKMTEIWYEGIDGIRVFYYFLCINLKLQKFLLC